MKLTPLASLMTLAIASNSNAATTPTLEEMWQIIQEQRAEIAALKAAQNNNTQRINETEVKAEASVVAVEQLVQSPASQPQRTHIGGYAEMHYNNLERDNDSSSKDEMDFHRFVLFAGHQFSDSVRFFSELELEHSIAGDGKEGEIELEQAFVEWDFAPNQRARAGLFLLPVGIINETHEPETFYGAERNNVERNIIPATWWEGGVGVQGEISPGLSYDAAIHSGLFIDPTGSNAAIRGGRQKVSEAKADDLAYTGRIKYTGIPGIELAASLQYQTDLLQGESLGPVSGVDATLFETHLVWQRDGFGLRALYAAWDIDSTINSLQSGADEQSGFYLEPSYRINDKLGIFARYSEWDNRAGDSLDSEITQWDIGFNYWLTEQVVFKADYQNQDSDSNTGDDGFNLGVGLSF